MISNDGYGPKEGNGIINSSYAFDFHVCCNAVHVFPTRNTICSACDPNKQRPVQTYNDCSGAVLFY